MPSLREVRKNAQWRREDIASLLKLSIGTIKNYETGYTYSKMYELLMTLTDDGEPYLTEILRKISER